MSNEIGEILEGKITSITNFGAFVALPDSRSGMIHISEISNEFVKDINSFLKVGQEVKVKVCSVDEKGRIALSLKQAVENNNVNAKKTSIEQPVKKHKIVPEPITAGQTEVSSFEDMMSRFMKTSNEKISDLKKTMDSKRSSPGFSRKNSKKY